MTGSSTISRSCRGWSIDLHSPNPETQAPMRAVVQRVTSARVTVNGHLIGEIGAGLLVLLGVEQNDGPADVQYLTAKVRDLRIFADDAGKMNLSVVDKAGGVLVVSQFTLSGDARNGRR